MATFSIPRLFVFMFSLTILTTSCQTATEEERFQLFIEKFDKTYLHQFPKGKYSDSELDKPILITEQEILGDLHFCNENLDKLAKFDLEALSLESQLQWKTAFQQLKQRLSEIEARAEEKSVE